MKTYSFKKKYEADKKIAKYISDISKKNNINILVSGGTSLFGVLKILSKTNSQYNFFLSDERNVNQYSSESNLNNYRLLKYPNMNFLGFLSSKNFKKSIKDYDNTLLNIKFDLAVLGVGTDGHVASIFPNESYIISETENSFYCKSKLHEYNRFSLKLDYILQSKKIILYFNGPKKIDAYKHFFNLDFYPLNEFLKKNKKLDIYLGEYI